MLVQVLGTHYSGSTMLDLMLGNHGDSLSLGEVFTRFYPSRPGHLKPVCRCGRGDCAIARAVLAAPMVGFHEQVARTTGHGVIVDSSKNLVWVQHSRADANRVKMPVADVVVWKPPELVAYSFWRHGRGWRAGLRQFLRYHHYLERLNGPYSAVAYESLIAEPVQVLQTVTDVLGLDMAAQQTRFWEGRYHQFFGNVGTRRQVGGSSRFVHPETTFPDGFRALLPRIRGVIEQDPRFARTVTRLRALDVGGVAGPPAIPGAAPDPAWLRAMRHAMDLRAVALAARTGHGVSAIRRIRQGVPA